MRKMDRVYIELELGMAEWNVDINNNAMDDILDRGIDCYAEDVYDIIYKGYTISEDKLKMMLNEPDNSDNMLFPLDCQRDLSYDDWLEYKAERDLENEIQDFFESKSVYKHRSNMKYEIRYKGKTLVSDCPRKLKGLLRDSWVS
mgnify:CR=1 FL=1|tara:strand:- start:1933 stop:2364 length:432 start_codon:yes stop_codon:yes gene_type:complete